MSEKTKILIIEDDPDAREAMKATLEAMDIEVAMASSTDVGLQVARDIEPHLIVLDVMFGDEQRSEGFECAVALKQDPSLARIPILMATAVNVRHPGFRFSPETDGEYLPVDAFIDKPVRPDDLKQKVQELLAQKESKWSNWPHPPEE